LAVLGYLETVLKSGMSRTYIFDAVHTILRPIPDVISAYHLAGQRHASELSKQEVKTRFRIARRQRFSTFIAASQTEAGSLPSSDAIEHQLWRDLVSDVFEDVRPIDTLFEQLWEHFASAENWQLYDDVAACWKRLQANGDRIVVASNFDSRLLEIVASHESLGLADAVFCSAEVGYRKPDPMFYKTVQDSFGIEESDEVIMIGDDFENDYVAPVRYGWKAFHLDRRATNNSDVRVIPSLDSIGIRESK